ncbi:unnamed protein product [Amoebophrya sp. A120]|nr:unnamed protein product [Amoebophrya sp. A120]|eukprot:GSA120T00018267001.1
MRIEEGLHACWSTGRLHFIFIVKKYFLLRFILNGSLSLGSLQRFGFALFRVLLDRHHHEIKRGDVEIDDEFSSVDSLEVLINDNKRKK